MTKTRLNKLTQRELEVLKLVVSDFQSKEIAEKFGTVRKTVEKQRQNILDKLGIHNVIRLTHFALHHNLVENLYRENNITE